MTEAEKSRSLEVPRSERQSRVQQSHWLRRTRRRDEEIRKPRDLGMFSVEPRYSSHLFRVLDRMKSPARLAFGSGVLLAVAALIVVGLLHSEDTETAAEAIGSDLLVQDPLREVPRGHPANNGSVGGSTLHNLMINGGGQTHPLLELIRYSEEQEQGRDIVSTGFSSRRSNGDRVQVSQSVFQTHRDPGAPAAPAGIGYDSDASMD